MIDECDVSLAPLSVTVNIKINATTFSLKRLKINDFMTIHALYRSFRQQRIA